MTGISQNTRPKLYLDIDGVFLLPTALQNYNCEWALPEDAEDFLDWALDEFDCFWLSARDVRGDRSEIERAFRVGLQSLSLPPFLVNALRKIEPARWSRNKTTGIDLDSDFYWIDATPDKKSVAELSRRGLTDRLITVEVGVPSSLELTNARQRITDRMVTASVG